MIDLGNNKLPQILTHITRKWSQSNFKPLILLMVYEPEKTLLLFNPLATNGGYTRHFKNNRFFCSPKIILYPNLFIFTNNICFDFFFGGTTNILLLKNKKMPSSKGVKVLVRNQPVVFCSTIEGLWKGVYWVVLPKRITYSNNILTSQYHPIS